MKSSKIKWTAHEDHLLKIMTINANSMAMMQAVLQRSVKDIAARMMRADLVAKQAGKHTVYH